MHSKKYLQIKFLYQTLRLSAKQIADKLSLPLHTVNYAIKRVRIESFGKTTDTVQYKTSKYLTWRQLVLERDGHKCVNCGCTRSRNNPLQVDHIKPKSVFPELSLTVSNGRTLCLKCHKKTNTFGRKNIYKYLKSIE